MCRSECRLSGVYVQLLLCVVGLTLATTNVMAYRRCSASGDSGQNSSFALFSSFSEVPKAAGSAAEGVKNWLAAQAGTAAVQNVLGRVGLGGTGQRGAGGGFGY
ncbi:putative transmembrane protein [Toxoplasma gondii TgCatPRC2]|uniref:Putative transmembrane protein n=1 Tax=Toxoplasma gondii TgCatPRC2 TaxID=1130821 RepID=A0A151HIF2_TOXGO|nr:putative transmembrane protein [Toxoplasma gondii TgCatPRC2]